MNKITKTLVSFLSLFALASCGGASESTNPTEEQKTSNSGGFIYEDPSLTEGDFTEPVFSDEEPVESQGRVSGFDQLDIQTLAVIDKEGEYIVEAEDLDLSGATMQEYCDHFYEVTDLASGGMCIACIASPTILAFQFELTFDTAIEFHIFSAKYEPVFDFDQNVKCNVDENDPFVTNYTSFGHNAETQWYNFKDITLGTLSLTTGTHTLYISVNGALPNTDCFKLITVNNAE